MSVIHNIKIELPEEGKELPGLIRMQFSPETWNFSYGYYDRFFAKDKKHHHEFQKHRAISHVLRMIERDLREAFEQAEKEI